jgi:hypothetical protein
LKPGEVFAILIDPDDFAFSYKEVGMESMTEHRDDTRRRFKADILLHLLRSQNV